MNYATTTTNRIDPRICPSWARATPSNGVWGKLEPADDEAPNTYIVRVSAEYDAGMYGHSAEIWTECELTAEPSGRMALKTRKEWHGIVAEWAGDLVGSVSDHPELETLCDRAKEAVERYLADKSTAWWKKTIASVLNSPGLDAELRVRLPRRKEYLVNASIEFVHRGDE